MIRDHFAFPVLFLASIPGENVLTLPLKLMLDTLVLRKENKGSVMLYLFGHLSKVADKPQDGIPDQGVTDVTEIHFVTIEVGVKGINSFHRSCPLLLVPKNEVYPMVEVGTDEFTFQSLEQKPKEHETCRPFTDSHAHCTDQDVGSAQEVNDACLGLVSSKWADVQGTMDQPIPASN